MTVDVNAQKTWHERIIAAPVETLFNLVAHPARHCEYDGSGTVTAAKQSGPERLSPGAKFGMKMKFFGVPYQISSKVVEFEENVVIAWSHFGGHRWRYEFEEVEGGTRVTETFDWSTAAVPKALELSPYPKAHDENIRKTLERLETVALAEAAQS